MKVIQTRGREKSLPRNTTMTPPTVTQTQDRRRRPLRSAMIALIATRIQNLRESLQKNIMTRVTRTLGPRKDIQGNITMRVTPILDQKEYIENMMKAIRIIRPGGNPPRNTIATATLTAGLRRKRPSNAMIGVILAQARAKTRERARIRVPNRLAKASTWRLRHQSPSENAMAATPRRNTMKDRRNQKDI